MISRKIVLLGVLLTVLLSACNLPNPNSIPTATLPPLPETPPAAENATTGAACIPGNWSLDYSQIDVGWVENRIRDFSGQEVNIDATEGTLAVQVLPDGRLIAYANDFSGSGTVQYQGMQMPVSVTIAGSAEGTYSLDESGSLMTLGGPLTGIEEFELTARVLVFTVFKGTVSQLTNGRSIPTAGSVNLEAICSGDVMTLSVSHPQTGDRTLELRRLP